ncbi:unnamed protein product [Cylicocyclus nassatus]|uniref:Histone-lysine N-methyltransferase n=1 Tax=Cylicocyclus nassatus TaxID=53992 RepID=A0AA36GDQ0_CYLNA|nr:unnamed protein product [Cylicocyclus nassatus]
MVKDASRQPQIMTGLQTDAKSDKNIQSGQAASTSMNRHLDEEISELFILRFGTYKKWASTVSKKKCQEILVDHFKNDLSNDFTLMINWLALTDAKSRTVLLESSCATKESMELDVALDMLTKMGVADASRRGPTVDAFRQLIAVLCGGTPGQVPELEKLALFTETTRFADKTASEIISRIVRTFFNFSNDVPRAMEQFGTSLPAAINPAEMMCNGTSAVELIRAANEPSTCGSICDSESGITISEDGGLELTCEEKPSVSSVPSVCDTANEAGSTQRSFSQSPTRSSSRKSRREIFSIRNRLSGKVGSHTLSDGCFVCGSNLGDLLHCGKKYAPGAYCSTTFHKDCIESYNAAEYNVNCIRKIVDETLCPLHFCSSCYLERWKTTAVRGKLVECDSCFRAFHEQCCPAGFESYEDFVVARSKEGNTIEVKQKFTRCHAHCDTTRIPLIASTRSHLPYCCECENIGDEPLTKCSLCVRSFHEGCLTLSCRDIKSDPCTPVCESCILGENLRIGQAVIARFKASFYAATVTSLAEYPKHCAKMDKFGKYLGQPGFVCVKWAGCINIFALLPARNVVPMFDGSYNLIGRRLSEIPCREAWEKMESELSISRPSFAYVPEKYTKIKTSVYHPSCPKPRLDACDESDSMCDCPPGEKGRCGPNSKCTNRAILQECPEACEAIEGGCNNRGVSRKEVNPDVEIREAPGKGLGAFAVKDIPKGSFIAEYAGELISITEKNRRIAEVTAHKNAEEKHYMMALDSQRIIDCKEKGNDARFLNHSCSPNCKVETVYVVVHRSKRPNGATVKYDKRITICTIEDVPAGTELCFNYQMTQYNIGCPLPDCKCGAPNCTGSLGAVVHEKVEKAVQEVEVVPNDSGKQVKGKQKRKAASSLASPKKKRSSARSRQSTPASSTSSSSRSPYKGQKNQNGKVTKPTVTFKRTSLPSKLDGNSSRTQTRSRGCRVINGFKEPRPEVLEDEKLKRALLNGEALEKLSDAKPLLQKGNQEAVNGLRKNHRRIAAELSSLNVMVS